MVENKSFRLIKGIENIVLITCIVVSDILADKKKFVGDKNEKAFDELRVLFSTNAGIVRDFAIDLIETFMFPPTEKRASLFKVDFMKVMENCNYLFIKAPEIRKKYTEYVYTHRQQASIAMKPIMRKTKARETIEEGKDVSVLDNEYRGSARQSYRADFLKDTKSLVKPR